MTSLREPYFRELFAAGLVWEKRGVMNLVRATCKTCGATHEMALATHLPTEVLIKKVHTLGWTNRRRTWTCSDCQSQHEALEYFTPLPEPDSVPQIPAPGLADLVSLLSEVKAAREILDDIQQRVADFTRTYQGGA